jgi:hypothetical protein
MASNSLFAARGEIRGHSGSVSTLCFFRASQHDVVGGGDKGTFRWRR